MVNIEPVVFANVRPPGCNGESAIAVETAVEDKAKEQNNHSPDPPSTDMLQKSMPLRQEKKKPKPNNYYGGALLTEEQFKVLVNAPRLETGVAARAMPVGVEIRNVKCLRDVRDAMMPNEKSHLKREDLLTTVLTQIDSCEPLNWQPSHKSRMSSLHGGRRPEDSNQQIVAEGLFDGYRGNLRSFFHDLGNADGKDITIPSDQPGKSKSKLDKVTWSITEDKALCSAYLEAGGGTGIATNTKRGEFWVNVMRIFEEAQRENPDFINQRNEESCKGRWRRINTQVKKWAGFYTEAQQKKESGSNEENIRGEAREMWEKANNGHKFLVEHCWDILKHLPKWQSGMTAEDQCSCHRLEKGVASRAKPSEVEIQNEKCLISVGLGHRSGDRECPLEDAIMPSMVTRLNGEEPLTPILAQTDSSEPLDCELKQKSGMSPPGGGCRPDDSNQPIIAENIFDEYGADLGSSRTLCQDLGDNDEEDITIPSNPHDNSKSRQDKLTWTIAEDKALCTAYLDAGGGNVMKSDRKKGEFWANVIQRFNEVQRENPRIMNQRNEESCRGRWRRINSQVKQWVLIYAEAQQKKKSDWNEDNVLEEARKMWENANNGHKFLVEHCWDILKHFSKWQSGMIVEDQESRHRSKRSKSNMPKTDLSPLEVKRLRRSEKSTISSQVDSDNLTNCINSLNANRDLDAERLRLEKQMFEYYKEMEKRREAKINENRRFKLYHTLMGKSELSIEESKLYARLHEEFKNI